MKVLTSLIAAALLVFVVGCAPTEEPAAAPTDTSTAAPAPSAGTTPAPTDPNAPAQGGGAGAAPQQGIEAPE